MSNYVAIKNTENSNTSRFHSKISVYFATAIMEHLVWQAVSNATGSHVQKLGGHAHPAPKLGRGQLPPPPPGSRVPDQSTK